MCVQGLLFSEHKKHRRRENKQVRLKGSVNSDACPHTLCSTVHLCLQSPSVAKAKADRALHKVSELIHSSPSILSSKGEASPTVERNVYFLVLFVLLWRHMTITRGSHTFFGLLHRGTCCFSALSKLFHQLIQNIEKFHIFLKCPDSNSISNTFILKAGRTCCGRAL